MNGPLRTAPGSGPPGLDALMEKTYSGVSPEAIAGDLRSLGEGLERIVGQRLVGVLAVGSVGRSHASGQGIGASSIEDYDIIVVADLPSDLSRLELRRRIARWVRDTNARLSLPASVGIRLRRELPRLPHTLFNYEMRYAHRVIAGTDPTAEMPAFPIEQLPLIEATRLLLNRGVLLWGECVRGGGAEGFDAVRRPLQLTVRKVVLALGDAILIAAAHYHWSYAERRLAIARSGGFEPYADSGLAELYRRALESKLNGEPVKTVGAELLDPPGLLQLHQRIFRDIEQRRLRHSVTDWVRYADEGIAYPPTLARSRLKRVGRTWKAFGPPRSLAFARSLASRSAEEILLRAFPALAYLGANALGSLVPRLNGPREADPRLVWQHFYRAWSRSQ